jgi:hypothetical protein
MPTIDDLLAVTAEIRLVATEQQPRLNTIINELEPIDSKILSILSKQTDPPATLKDYILARAQHPTQSLTEIMAGISNNDLATIDKDHLLINLIAAATHEASKYDNQFGPDDIGTILKQFITLTMYNAAFAADPKAKIEYVNCVSASGSLSSEVASDLANCQFLSDNSAQYLKYTSITPNKLPLLQQALKITYTDGYMSHPFDEYKVAPDSFSVSDKNTKERKIYSVPPTIVAKIYEATSDPGLGCELPLPMIGCYSHEILEKYMTGNEGNTFLRPISLPSYLPSTIKQLFYGVRADENGEVRYDLYSDDPTKNEHFKDMLRAHDTRVGAYGVQHHDEYHISKDNDSDGLILRRSVILAIKSLLSVDPTNSTLLKMLYSTLDLGVTGLAAQYLQGYTSDEDPNLKMFNQIVNSTPKEMQQPFIDVILRLFNVGSVAELEPGMAKALQLNPSSNKLR